MRKYHDSNDDEDDYDYENDKHDNTMKMMRTTMMKDNDDEGQR